MKQTERGPIYGPRARSLGGTGDCSSPAAAAPAEQLPSSRPHMPAVRLIPKAIPKEAMPMGAVASRLPMLL